MSHRATILLTLFAFLAISSVYLGVSAENEKIVHFNKIEFKSGVLKLPHDSFANIKFSKHFYTSPSRLVLDFLNSELQGGSKEYSTKDIEHVSKVKVAQFKKGVVRVVIEGDSRSFLEKIAAQNIGRAIYINVSEKLSNIEDIYIQEGNVFIRSDDRMVVRSILLDSPDRLVIDIVGAKLKKKDLAPLVNLGRETLKIRQFDDSVVRLVFFGGDNYEERKIKLGNGEKLLVVVGDGEYTLDNSQILKDKILSINLIRNSTALNTYVIKASKDIKYKSFWLNNPKRLVLDVIGLEFDDTLRAKPIPPTKLIRNVRFGNASSSNPTITRLVFDSNITDLQASVAEDGNTNSIQVKFFSKSIRGTDFSDMVDLDTDTNSIQVLEAQQVQKANGLKVLIDPGHGGYDPGAMYGGYEEKNITSLISIKLKKYLESMGYQVFMTRNEDRFISLAERVEISNSINPDMFVSVHVNALATNRSMDGIQTYYYSPTGYKIAGVIHNQLLSDIGMSDGRVRKAAFWVCKHTKSPSVLLELGFMTNAKERAKLVTDSYQDTLAKSVARGINKYLRSK